MIRRFKKTLIAGSLVTLLPILWGLLLWGRFPAQVVTHTDLSGAPDSWGSPTLLVFGMPLIFLALQWLGVWATGLDRGHQGQNEKPLKLAFWIVPLLSNLLFAMMANLSLGEPVLRMQTLLCLIFGLLFAAFGNYLPKCAPNRTMGIKLTWTLGDAENWNATHRMAGPLWLGGGCLAVVCGFLPGALGIAALFGIIALMVILPTVYSYRFYRKKVAAGTDPAVLKYNLGKWSWLLIVGILAVCSLILLTGDLDYQFGPETLTVKTAYYDDLTVPYAAIESVEYRETGIPGYRVFGWGSFRLEMGLFESEALGRYTRYTYYHPSSHILIYVNGTPMVLSGRTPEDTQALYESLLEKVGF